MAVLVWAAASFGLAVRDTFAEWRRRATLQQPAFLQRFGTPRAEALARCLATVATVVPSGDRLAFLDRRWDSFARWRWTAYFLPSHDVVLEQTPEAESATYLLALGDEAPSRGSPVGRGSGCRLYRLR